MRHGYLPQALKLLWLRRRFSWDGRESNPRSGIPADTVRYRRVLSRSGFPPHCFPDRPAQVRPVPTVRDKM